MKVKMINRLMEEIKQLSLFSVMTLKATYILFLLLLGSALLLAIVPQIAGNRVDAVIYSHQLCEASARILVLGSIAALCADFIRRK